jgi:NADH-quinone oxidoreductase subunit L
VPLVILAGCAILLSLVAWPSPWLQRTLDPHFHEEHGGAGLLIISIVLVALGIGAGWAIYGRRPRTKPSAADPLAVKAPGLFSALGARLGFDELYAATVGQLNCAFAAFADGLDRYVLDGAVRFLSRLGEFAGVVNREADEDVLNGGFDATSEKIRGSGKVYSRAQTGEAHGYLRMIAVGFVLLAFAVLLGGAW